MAKNSKKKKINKLNSSVRQGASCFIEAEKVSRLTEMEKMITDAGSRHTGAVQEINLSYEQIDHIISINRGGKRGMHGFIGENMQVHLSNAWDIIKGLDPRHVLVDDNGMTDYFRCNIAIQQKACISDNCLGLSHILEHAKKYPAFDGVYQIPQDQFSLLTWYRNMSPDFAAKLQKAEYRQYKKVMKYLDLLKGKKIEPMVVRYDEIQAGKAHTTLGYHKEKLDIYYQGEKTKIISAHRPTVRQCVRTAGISAGLQGGIKLISSTVSHSKKKNGLKHLDRQDWIEIGKETTLEAGKGAIHGAGVYAMTNCIPGVSANAAAAVMNFGIESVSDTYKYCRKEISGKEFGLSILDHGAEAGFTAAFAKIGGKLIPVPFLGEAVGGVVGSGAYRLVKFLGGKYVIPMLEGQTKSDQLLAELPAAG
ncbi:MAG: hypothetical protein IJI45_14040 [Anaerolineaceae bacterium]|nr:hypothetical protein [Anaerolineaceae bacterium]